MIKFERVSVMNLENAIRGARNPMNSWDKSDSAFDCSNYCNRHTCRYYDVGCSPQNNVYLGPNDLSLLMRLRNAGTDHRKFMRQIMVSVDITAPLYWWKEFDTYKVGTVANSCSTMHKIHAKEFTRDDFSHDHLMPSSLDVLDEVIDFLNDARDAFVDYDSEENEDIREHWSKKDCWWQMIQLLPSSYNQLRTITLNYEALANMYAARKEHKLDEWREMCKWIETLPYSQLITGEEKDG